MASKVSKSKVSSPSMSVESGRELLRAANLRSTPSRLAVLEKISSLGHPISHAEMSDLLEPLGFDKSTIYRVLMDLSESSILSRIDAGDHNWRFELRSGPDKDGHHSSEHPHFVCNDCGKIECLEDVTVSVKEKNKSTNKKERQVDAVFFKGTCGDCR